MKRKPFFSPKWILVLLLCCFQLPLLAAETIKISGKVLDDKGEPVIGASVVVKGTSIGAMVSEDGSYTISAPSNGTLVTSFTGYTNVETPVNGQRSVDITMASDGELIDEVIVVGYGQTKRANVTGAVASMSAKEVQDIPVANLSTALQGRMAGVKVGQSSGKPGASTTLQIRESSSYGASEIPLYVIDGVIRDQAAFDILDPSEVESISILKDASAAVYGARAAGGVVLVQTKRGKEGKTKITYNGSVGLTQAINPTTMLSAHDHAQMVNDVYDVKKIAATSQDRYSSDELRYFKDSLPGGGYDWFGDAWKTAMVTRHSLNVSGGSKTVRYFVGGSYYYETGSIQGLYTNKYSVKSSVEMDLFKGLVGGISLNLDNRQSNTPINPSDTQSDLMDETFRALLQNPKWIPPTITGSDGVVRPVSQKGQISNNPYAIWNSDDYKYNESDGANYIIFLNYKLPWVDGLSARLQFSQTKSKGFGKTYYTHVDGYNFKTKGTNGHIIDLNTPKDSITTTQISGTSSLEESTDASSSYQINASLSYNKRIGLHDISAIVVSEISEGNSNRVGWKRDGAQVIPGLDQLVAFQQKDQALATNTGATGSVGYVGRLNYNYGSRYIGEFSFRVDASSKFSPQNRWGFFPAGALGWVVSEEDWFKQNISFVDFFKLRASAGLLGNDNTSGSFFWKYMFGSANGVLFGSQPTNGLEAKNGGFANPDITWQKTQSYNAGFDSKFWGNKIGVNIDGFYKYTYDILAPVATTNPTTVGIPSSSKIPFNYGIMNAYGCEAELSYYDKLPFDINYYVKGNFAWSIAQKLKVAQSPGAIGKWYDELKNNISNQPGAINTGMVRTDEDVRDILMDNPNYSVGAPLEPGMLNYRDIRGADGSEGPNGVFSNDIAEDRTVIAALTSPPYTYGATLGLSWKGLRLDATFSGKFGHDVFYDKNSMAPPDATHNVPAFWKDHWTPNNRNAAFPRATEYGQVQQVSTFWMRDGHTLRMTDLSLSYVLPQQISSKLGIAQLRVYFNTQNLWTIINPFDYKDANLSNYNGYPMTRTYVFGMSFTL